MLTGDSRVRQRFVLEVWCGFARKLNTDGVAPVSSVEFEICRGSAAHGRL